MTVRDRHNHMTTPQCWEVKSYSPRSQFTGLVLLQILHSSLSFHYSVYFIHKISSHIHYPFQQSLSLDCLLISLIRNFQNLVKMPYHSHTSAKLGLGAKCRILYILFHTYISHEIFNFLLTLMSLEA